ncbi:hypothetical protein MBLNU230_g2059t1 [Neophaeotheca triangularis]
MNNNVNTGTESMLDVDGPPSSPFLSEVNDSRVPSGYFKSTDVPAIVEEKENLLDIQSPEKPDFKASSVVVHEDKENMAEPEPTLRKLFASPKKSSTPEPLSARKAATPEKQSVNGDRKGSVSSVAMPPPSTRKLHSTPRKTPLKASRSAANTPGPLSRGNSYDETTPQQQVSAFQAGLDMRAAAMPPQDQTNVDETCFSDFSQVPDMTLFAKLRQSPTKQGDVTRTPGKENVSRTPRTSRKRLSSSRSPSPTPRKLKTPSGEKDENTSFLIDFTQQFESGPSQHSGRAASPAKSATQPNLLQYINDQRSPGKSASRQSYATPQKQSNIMNLLDFELPPAPTPRSIPTITVRELESLKSSYLSQISSLKANLSGREAEVESLKRAVADAERRSGEAQESLREERCKREHVEEEKASWEKRGQEVEVVLKNVKNEVMKGEAEKDEMRRRIEDDERKIEEAEERAVKAEERFADALAARADAGDGGNASATEEQVQRLVAAQIDAKIEAVSRELHAVYKEKHERKVATLKKSYEARSEKKLAELQSKLAQLETEKDELVGAKDATSSGPVQARDDSELKAELESQRAHLARLESELQSSHTQQEHLVRELKQERIEKGDLVAAVDEMLAVQNDLGSDGAPATPAKMQGAMSAVEDFRKSISRPSGLKPPGESKIGRGIPPPGAVAKNAGGGKSRMLANIERMGRKGGE